MCESSYFHEVTGARRRRDASLIARGDGRSVVLGMGE